MRFEKRTKRVMYVQSGDIYRVTSDPVTDKRRNPMDTRRHLVGVAAAVTFWDSVDRRNHCLGCARTVKEAWKTGDRYLLDTDEARKAAELVADLADSKPDAIDICAALVDLQNAIAKVRLSNTPLEAFDVLPACTAALEKCYGIPEFIGWSVQAQRRRFLYELQRKDRTSVTYTLMGLYFKHGATPLLTSKQRQELLALPREDGVSGAVQYLDNCLRQMTAYCFS
jgi:hypothetical protein